MPKDKDRRTIVSVVVEEDDETILHSGVERQPRTVRAAIDQLIGLLSVIYAIFFTLMGVLFTLSAGVKNGSLNDMHSEGIFSVYVYTSAIVFLLGLQVYILPRSRDNHLEAEKRRMEAVQASVTDSSAHEQLIEDNLAPRRIGGAKLLRISSAQNEMKAMTVSPSVLTKDTVASQIWVDVRKLNDAFAHSGTTFYLRFGTLVFGLGNMVYVGLEIHYHLILPVQKNYVGELYGWIYVLRLIFLLVQTFFLLKNHQAHVTVFTKLARFGFMHLISTNFYVWFRTLVAEILHEMHQTDHSPDNSTSAGDGTDGRMVDSHVVHQNGVNTSFGYTGNVTDDFYPYTTFSSFMRNSATPYLFPFILEYSLIAVGIFTVMCSEVGQTTPSAFLSNLHIILQKCKNKDGDNDSYDCEVDNAINSSTDRQVTVALHGTEAHGPLNLKSSHRGMFLGFVHLAAMLVIAIVFFFEEGEGGKRTATFSYYLSDIFTQVALTIAAVAALVLLNKLPLKPKPMHVDDVILLVSMCGACFLEFAQVLALSTFVLSKPLFGLARSNAALAVTDAILTICQTVVQVVLIFSGLRRYSVNGRHNVGVEHRPGREEVTFLLIANVTVWLCRSIHIKELGLDAMIDFYGDFAWLLIVNINLPLLLFFRFHSSVCFSEIWSSAYIPRKLCVHTEPAIKRDTDSTFSPDTETFSLRQEHFSETESAI